ncbi:hypothetical protein P8452_26771 [Trifolium repens]|nr:hypothetical protein P8452_26771 [Trifolium repens]
MRTLGRGLFIAHPLVRFASRILSLMDKLRNKQPRLEMKQPPQPKPDQRSSFSMKPKRTEPPGKGINHQTQPR